MAIISKTRRKVKMPPPQPMGWRDGRPILAGVLGKPDRFGDRSIRVVCPRCGKTNSHGWPISDTDDKPGHKADHCGCWKAAPSGYYVVPAEQVTEAAK